MFVGSKAVRLGSRAAATSPTLCPDWVELLAKEVTGLPKPPLHPQEVAVCLGGSAMVLEFIGGKDFEGSWRSDPIWRVIGCLSEARMLTPFSF